MSEIERRQNIIERSISVPFIDGKNVSKLIDSYIKYNIFSRFKHPDMLSIVTISEIDYPDYEYNKYDDETFKVYYFFFKGKFCIAVRDFERVNLLYSKKEENIGYFKDNNEWYSGYHCHLIKDNWIFIESSHYLKCRYNKANYIPIKAYKIEDRYQSFSEFKDSLLKRFYTIAKIIKCKGVDFYYDLTVSFNDEILFNIKDSEGNPTIQNFNHYKKEVNWWSTLLQHENENETEVEN